MAKYRTYLNLSEDEVACMTCVRQPYPINETRCRYCIRWSEWKGLKQLNNELIAKGMAPYKDLKVFRKWVYGHKYT